MLFHHISKAIFRELKKGGDLVSFTSKIAMYVAILTSVTPLIGGIIQYYSNWRYNFIFILGLCFITGIFMFNSSFIIEKDWEKEKKEPTGLLAMLIEILTDRIFMRYNLLSAFAYTLLMVFLTEGTFIFQLKLHLSAFQYGLLSMSFTGFYIIGSLVTSRLSKILTNFDVIIMIGIACLITATSVIAFNYFILKTYNLLLMFSYGALLSIAISMIFPSSSGQAFSNINKI